MDPGKKNLPAIAAAVVMIPPLLLYMLGWTVYRDPADDGFHMARQTSFLLPCSSGDFRVFSTKLLYGPSDQARRQRLQDIEDGRAKLDCRAGLQELGLTGL